MHAMSRVNRQFFYSFLKTKGDGLEYLYENMLIESGINGSASLFRLFIYIDSGFNY